MNNKPRIQSLIPLAAFALVLAFVSIILIMAAPTAADAPEDYFAFIPLVSSPLLPVDTYETGFDSSIEPWKAVRWQSNSSHVVAHGDECESSHCGFLDLAEQAAQSYVIASPLIAGPERSYNIIFRAKWHDPKDQHQYGAIFSADASGHPCPGDNTTSCFNQYYEFQARYRSVSGEKFVEYRLRRIDGHDENNVQIVKNLTDWTLADGVDAHDFIKWEIIFRASGQIYVKANNLEQSASARDSKYNDQRFFGLTTGTFLGDDALVRFDKFSIEKQE